MCVYVCELLPPLEKEKRTPAVCKLCSRNHNAEFSRGRHFLFNTPRLHVLLVRRDVRGPGKTDVPTQMFTLGDARRYLPTVYFSGEISQEEEPC